MGRHKSNIDYRIIGTKIRELRKEKGLTQERLGEISGIEPCNISHIERGATKLSLPPVSQVGTTKKMSPICKYFRPQT